MPLFFISYHGEIGIEIWEYLICLVYVMILYIYFARKKVLIIKAHDEYKYYLSGVMVKFVGAIFFTLIYVYYYSGGDTIAYFYSGVAMKRMFFINPVEFLNQVIMGDNSAHALSSYASESIRPYSYVFSDSRTFQALRVSTILAIFTFNSFLVSNLLIASLSFFGVWAGYRTYVSYFPEISGRLAVAFLFMPSAIFWGSSILKDTFTFSAVCAWIYAVDEVFFKRRNVISRLILMLFCAMVMIQVKPYIFMVILPATMLWLLYMRVVRIKNTLIRFVLIPIMALALVALSISALQRMGDMMNKFALDEALVNIENIQLDMARSDAYSDNKFDVGEFDGTWWGVVKKFPVAVNASLFRPYLWESRSIVIALSGLENLFVLALTVYVWWKAGLRFSLRCIASNPLLLMSMTFALLFAFAIGVSTPNFGALVRFKIPLLPFYISSLFIILFLRDEKRKAKLKGKRFDLTAYWMPASVVRKDDKDLAAQKHPLPRGVRGPDRRPRA